MHLADNQPDLPGLGDIPAAIARAAHRAPGLATCPVDHVALCVEAANLPRYVEQVVQQLPAARVSDYCIGDRGSGMRIVELRDVAAAVHLVLAAPTGSRGQLVEFLALTGAEGLQHIAFAVPDARAAVAELAARGLRFEGGADAPERAVIEARDGDNWVRQAFTEPLFDGFFIEVIERRGILGMRARNIDALYALKAQGEHRMAS
jgi:4-hydroxyphenylpyruvate dioxygenase-like putative hemolysin